MKDYEAKLFARELRKNSTKSESIFWSIVRKRQILGLRFLRQFKIEHSNVNRIKNFFFVDFYCHEIKLVVEVDGDIHDFQKDYDLERQNILEEMRYKIFRIKNNDVQNDQKLKEFIKFCESLKSQKNELPSLFKGRVGDGFDEC